MDSERTKRLMLECERELEEARKAEIDDWLFSIIGSGVRYNNIFSNRTSSPII